jgi:Domain of unknown function (DUF4190)
VCPFAVLGQVNVRHTANIRELARSARDRHVEVRALRPEVHHAGTNDLAPTGAKACAYCGELIRAEARKCRFCGEWFDDGAELAAPARAAGPRQVQTNGLAVGSFLCAILGGGLGAIPALILGVKARRQIRDSNGSMSGDGWAVAGLVLGWSQVAVLSVVLFGGSLEGSAGGGIGGAGSHRSSPCWLLRTTWPTAEAWPPDQDD